MNKLLQFIRLLREAGIRISIPEIIDCCNALCYIDAVDKSTFKDILLCTLVKQPDDIEIFERVFRLFFIPEKADEEQLSDEAFQNIIDNIKDTFDDFDTSNIDKQDDKEDENNNINDSDSITDSEDGNDNKTANNDGQEGNDDNGNNNANGENNNENDSKDIDENTTNSNEINSSGNSDASSNIANNTSNKNNDSSNSNISNKGDNINDSSYTSDIRNNSTETNGKATEDIVNTSNNTTKNDIENDITTLDKKLNDLQNSQNDINADFSTEFNASKSIKNLLKFGSEAELKEKAQQLAEQQFAKQDAKNIQDTCNQIMYRNNLELERSNVKQKMSYKQCKHIDEQYEKLKDFIQDEIELALVRQFGAEMIQQFTSDDMIYDMDITMLNDDDKYKIYKIIKRLIHKFNTNISRKFAIGHKGKLDIRKTIEKSIKDGSSCSELIFKRRKLTKHSLFILCDVSYSVYDYIPFMLQIVKGIQNTFEHIECRIFIDTTMEVDINDDFSNTSIFSQLSLGHGTDYYNVFNEVKDMNITNKMIVIILGDGENTNSQSAAANLKHIYNHCKALYWLNPLDKSEWRTTEMESYIPYCTNIYRCKTLRDIEYFVKALSHI